MRWAILGVLLLIALAAAAIAGLVVSDVSLEELRDVVIVVYGALGVLLLLVLIVAVLGLWFAVRLLTRAVVDLIEDPVRPALDDLRASARNVRGASEFVTDSTVHPLIRVLSVARGIRRGVGRLAGLVRRGR